jgi:DnaJ-class molecular chaperone
LLLKVSVEDHPVFKRDAENIISEAKIPFTTAALGGNAAIDTLDGLK